MKFINITVLLYNIYNIYVYGYTLIYKYDIKVKIKKSFLI